jgi:hypothetical protein
MLQEAEIKVVNLYGSLLYKQKPAKVDNPYELIEPIPKIPPKK